MLGREFFIHDAHHFKNLIGFLIGLMQIAPDPVKKFMDRIDHAGRQRTVLHGNAGPSDLFLEHIHAQAGKDFRRQTGKYRAGALQL